MNYNDMKFIFDKIDRICIALETIASKLGSSDSEYKATQELARKQISTQSELMEVVRKAIECNKVEDSPSEKVIEGKLWETLAK
jgi:hypothetical protein